MDNRFGFKDLVNAALLLCVIIVVLLAMKQYDRQWDVLQSIDDRLAAQTETLVAINESLRAGARANASTASSSATASNSPALAAPDVNPFYRLLAPRDNPDFAFGDWCIDSFGQTVGKLTPLISTDVYQNAIEAFVLESLITRDPQSLEWKPWIARSWAVSPDGLTITFELRDNVVFSDGKPLTSEDVVFTYGLMTNPEINAPRLRSYYENVESVTAEGPHRVVFRLKEPYFLSLSITGGMGIMPKHWYERFTPEEYNKSTGLLFGSGPYQLAGDPEDWQPGSGRIELVRNERYWGPRGTFDRLVYREITDETAELTSFRNQEIDRYGVNPEQYNQLKTDPDLLDHADLYEYETPTGGYRYLGWNQLKEGKPTPFADVRVRRAMTMLTNREEMAQQLMAGLASVASGPFHRLSDQANPNITPWPYNPEQAKALLKEAGYEDRNADGILDGPDGQPFRFKLVYPSTSQNYQQMALYLKDAYARAGIILEPDPTEWNTMLQRIDDRNFDAITLGWGGTVESDPKQIFHSSANVGGGDNYVSYKNPELDKLIDEARVTVDDDARLALWHRVHQILHEDQPYTFLFNSKAVVFIDKRIKNVEVTRTGINERTEMYVPRELQRWTKQ